MARASDGGGRRVELRSLVLGGVPKPTWARSNRSTLGCEWIVSGSAVSLSLFMRTFLGARARRWALRVIIVAAFGQRMWKARPGRRLWVDGCNGLAPFDRSVEPAKDDGILC